MNASHHILYIFCYPSMFLINVKHKKPMKNGGEEPNFFHNFNSEILGLDKERFFFAQALANLFLCNPSCLNSNIQH
jgi:hypothetical protein